MNVEQGIDQHMPVKNDLKLREKRQHTTPEIIKENVQSSHRTRNRLSSHQLEWKNCIIPPASSKVLKGVLPK